MALRYGFYNSINHDRLYDALDMGSIFDGIIEDGIFATIGNMFAVKPGEGLQIIVDTGKAWFNHTWTSNDAPIPMDLDDADITLSRYDAVVLEINNEQAVRANSIKIISGSPSSSPDKPSLVQTDLIHQYPLAYINISGGATSLTSANIEIMVGRKECPFITGPLETVPIDDLFAQWESEFDYWFENVKTNLEGDVAANLQRQIDLLKTADNIVITENTSDALGLEPPASVEDALIHVNQKTLTLGDILLSVRSDPGSEYLLANGEPFSVEEFPDAQAVLDPLYSHWMDHQSEDHFPTNPWVSSNTRAFSPKFNVATDGSRYCYIENSTETSTPGTITLRYTSDFKTWNTKNVTLQGEYASPIRGGIVYNTAAKMWYIVGRYRETRTGNYDYWTWCVWGTANFDLASWGLIGKLYESDQAGSRAPTSHAFCLNDASAVSICSGSAKWYAYSKDLSTWTNVLWGNYGAEIKSFAKLGDQYLITCSDNTIRKTSDLSVVPTTIETVSEGISPCFLFDDGIYMIVGTKMRRYTSVDSYEEYEISYYTAQKTINAISAFSVNDKVIVVCEGTDICSLIGDDMTSLSQAASVSASKYGDRAIPKTGVFKNRPRIGTSFYDVVPCVPKVSVDNVYAYVRMVK